MKPHKLKPIIEQNIITFMDMFRVGDQLRTEDVHKYCRRMTNRYMNPDTVGKYMRLLRDKDVINYTCVSKSERIIKIIEIGEPHSL